MYGAWQGYKKYVQRLLAEPGIDVNKQSPHGSSALIYAAANGHFEIAQILLAVPNINVHLQDQDGRCALAWAAHEGHKEIAQMLLAVPGIDDQGLNRALAHTVEKNHTGIVDLLEKEMRWA